MLPGIDLRDLGQHVALTAGRQAELAERREEMVMGALSARLKPSIDHALTICAKNAASAIESAAGR